MMSYPAKNESITTKKEKLENELKEMQTISNEFKRVGCQLSNEYLRLLSYLRSAISFDEKYILKMYYSMTLTDFYECCVGWNLFYFAGKGKYIRCDSEGNKLDQVEFVLNYRDPLNFVQSEKVKRIVEVMRRKKENEQPYYEFSTELISLTDELNDLVESLIADKYIFSIINKKAYIIKTYF